MNTTAPVASTPVIVAPVITRDLCRALTLEVEAAVAAIAKRHGLAVKVGGGSFSKASFTPRVEFEVPGAGAAAEEDAFRRFAAGYGLTADMLGRTFTSRGKRYKVVGMALSRSKNCVKIARQPDGKVFVAPPSMLLAAVFAPVVP